MARVYDKAEVFDNARISGRSEVFGKVCVSGEAKVFSKACVYDEAQVFGKACVCGEAEVFGKVIIHDKAKVFGKACVGGTTTLKTTAFIHTQYNFLTIESIGPRNDTTTFYKTKEGGIDVACGCFRGSIEEFLEVVEKTHGGNKHGKQYLKIIQFAKGYLS